MSMSSPPASGLDPRVLARKSKKLSWLLRHGAREAGLPMDAEGFAPIEQVLRLTGMTRAELDAVVADNNKARFQLRNGEIRAVQGHSLGGLPVTLEALERSWEEVLEDAPIYHGTSVAAARSILAGEGIHPAARTHVHLASAVEAKVGKRAGVDVLLVIAPPALRASGQRVYRAPNGVLLCRSVPVGAIVEVLASNDTGQRSLAELREHLSPPPAR